MFTSPWTLSFEMVSDHPPATSRWASSSPSPTPVYHSTLLVQPPIWFQPATPSSDPLSSLEQSLTTVHAKASVVIACASVSPAAAESANVKVSAAALPSANAAIDTTVFPAVNSVTVDAVPIAASTNLASVNRPLVPTLVKLAPEASPVPSQSAIEVLAEEAVDVIDADPLIVDCRKHGANITIKTCDSVPSLNSDTVSLLACRTSFESCTTASDVTSFHKLNYFDDDQVKDSTLTPVVECPADHVEDALAVPLILSEAETCSEANAQLNASPAKLRVARHISTITLFEAIRMHRGLFVHEPAPLFEDNELNVLDFVPKEMADIAVPENLSAVNDDVYDFFMGGHRSDGLTDYDDDLSFSSTLVVHAPSLEQATPTVTRARQSKELEYEWDSEDEELLRQSMANGEDIVENSYEYVEGPYEYAEGSYDYVDGSHEYLYEAASEPTNGFRQPPFLFVWDGVEYLVTDEVDAEESPEEVGQWVDEAVIWLHECWSLPDDEAEVEQSEEQEVEWHPSVLDDSDVF